MCEIPAAVTRWPPVIRHPRDLRAISRKKTNNPLDYPACCASEPDLDEVRHGQPRETRNTCRNRFPSSGRSTCAPDAKRTEPRVVEILYVLELLRNPRDADDNGKWGVSFLGLRSVCLADPDELTSCESAAAALACARHLIGSETQIETRSETLKCYYGHEGAVSVVQRCPGLSYRSKRSA